MKTCTTQDLYKALNFCDGETVLPGIRKKVYFIKKANILTFPKLPTTVTTTGTMGELATLKTDFVLAADKKWNELDVLTSDSNVSSESQGEKPSKTFLNKASLKHAGNDAEAAAFCRMANNDDLVYLIQQRGGAFRLVGNEMFETDTKPSQASGSKETDASGTTIEISVTDQCPAPFYAGKIETESGNISGEDGSVVSTGA